MQYNCSMKQRYKYRIYPEAAQRKSLAQLFGCSRVVWNDALAKCQRLYEEGEKYPGSAALMRSLTAAKKTEKKAWLSDVAAVPLQQSLRDLDVAFRNFFSSVTGKRKGAKSVDATLQKAVVGSGGSVCGKCVQCWCKIAAS